MLRRPVKRSRTTCVLNLAVNWRRGALVAPPVSEQMVPHEGSCPGERVHYSIRPCFLRYANFGEIGLWQLMDFRYDLQYGELLTPT